MSVASGAAEGRRGGVAPATLTIGDVLAHLKPEFPDLTISKIRFLEGEGLVQPERTPSGYRKFSAADVARLRYVLAQQKEHYLPLKVIKEQLEAIDRGLVPPGSSGTATSAPRVPHMSIAAIEDNAPTGEHFRPAPAAMRLSREELLNAAGLRNDQLGELEQFGLISKRPGGHYDDDALAVGKIVAELAKYGLEGRHLRAFRTAADRQAGLLEALVLPSLRARSPERRRAGLDDLRALTESAQELSQLLLSRTVRKLAG